VCGDEVVELKPAPDVYLEACRLLGVRPADAVALEDSPTGVASARAAGLFVVGIPSVPGVQVEADLVARSLSEPSVRAALGLSA
jgi:beta-phosphoglucomutase-like phosphatase (HAD superfamily)